MLLLGLEVIEIPQVQHSVVVRKVYCVYVPGHFFPIRNVVVVAHATVLGAEAAAGTDISGIGRPQLVGEDVNAFTWLNLDLSDNILERYRWEDLLDR